MNHEKVERLIEALESGKYNPGPTMQPETVNLDARRVRLSRGGEEFACGLARRPELGYPVVLTVPAYGGEMRRVTTGRVVAVAQRSDEPGVYYFETRNGTRYVLEDLEA